MSRDVAAVAFHDPRPPGKHIAAGAAEDLRRQAGRRQTGRQLRAVDHQTIRLLPAGQGRRQLRLLATVISHLESHQAGADQKLTFHPLSLLRLLQYTSPAGHGGGVKIRIVFHRGDRYPDVPCAARLVQT